MDLGGMAKIETNEAPSSLETQTTGTRTTESGPGDASLYRGRSTIMVAPVNTCTRPLFGGAMTIDMPTSFLDVSDVRQVPDHQECWQDVNAGQLLVIEILQYQSDVSDDTAASYFFEDLRDANGTSMQDSRFQAISSSNDTIRQRLELPSTARLCPGVGYQRVLLGREVDIGGNPRIQEERFLRVDLCAIRLPSVETDLLVTLSTPTTSLESSPQGPEGVQMSSLFESILATLKIRDWNLFG